MKIGISARRDKKRYFVNQSYLVLFNNEIVPIFLFSQNIDELLALCDGFMILGGDDINPSLYNEKNIFSNNIDDAIDELDFKILRYSIKNNKPVLGICRGIQSINVFFKGSLLQDIEHKEIYHEVKFINNSKYLPCIRKNKKEIVNSYHHQAINILGENLVLLGKSNDIIEIVEHKYYPIIGVQWHPELMLNEFNNNLIKDFFYLVKENYVR